MAEASLLKFQPPMVLRELQYLRKRRVRQLKNTKTQKVSAEESGVVAIGSCNCCHAYMQVVVHSFSSSSTVSEIRRKIEQNNINKLKIAGQNHTMYFRLLALVKAPVTRTK